MTIDSVYRPEDFLPDGENEFTFQYESIGNTAIKPYLIENGVLVELTEDVDWTTELPRRGPIYKGGNLLLTLDPTDTVRMLRKTPIINPFAATPSQPLIAEAFEFAMDQATLIQQEIEGHACACPEFPSTGVEGLTPPDIGSTRPECGPYSCDAFSELNPTLVHTDITVAVTGEPVIPLKIGRWTPFAAGGSWITWNRQMGRLPVNSIELDKPRWCDIVGQTEPLALRLNASPASPSIRGQLLINEDAAGILSFHMACVVKGDSGDLQLRWTGTDNVTFGVTFGLLNDFGGARNSIDGGAPGAVYGARLTGDDFTWRYCVMNARLYTVASGNPSFPYKVMMTCSMSMTGYETITTTEEYGGDYNEDQIPTYRDYAIFQASTNNYIDVADLIDSDLEITQDTEAYFNRKFPDYQIPDECRFTGDEI